MRRYEGQRFRIRTGKVAKFPTCENPLGRRISHLPLYFYVHLTLRHPTVKGWYPTLLDHHPYKYVYLAKEEGR